MAVYYKFKSAKDYDSVRIDGHFIPVGQLKEKIFELKHLGRGTDFDLVVTNAQTNEEYLDEGMLIPKNTSVLIRRVPGCPRKPIVTTPVTEHKEPNVETNSDDVQAVRGAFVGVDPSAIKYAEDYEWDEFGNDLYAIPETVPVKTSVPFQDAHPVSKEDEESMIKALIDTPALDWQNQPSDGFGPGRGFGRGMGGRMMGGRGFGRGGFEKKTPPQGYICHRCKVSGHFIQHCPTNGDPNFDVRRVKPPTGIPKSMLMATPDGSYALPSGAAAVLKPNESAFEKEIEGMPSTRSVGDLPPELHCPLCKEVMKDAVLTSKCCLTSFCDRCIRDHIISKSMCICGATNILADDLLPNKTVRDTINRILESNYNSAEKGGSAFQAQDMESRIPQAKVPSPTHSAASKSQQVPAPSPQRDASPTKIADTVEKLTPSNLVLVQEKGRVIEAPDVSEATHESKTVKEAALQGSAPLADEEVQQKPISEEGGKKKKKKKLRMPTGGGEMQWGTGQEHGHENYMNNMMSYGPGFNPYWNGMQPGFDGFMPPPYGGPMPYMGYGPGPMDVPFGPHDPFGGPNCMMPPYMPPQPHRDLAELAMGGFNAARPPVMSREEFEARKADLKRKREMERQSGKEGEYGGEGSSVSSRTKLKPTPSSNHKHTRDEVVPRPTSKKKSDQEQQHSDHRETHRHRDRDRGHHNHRSSRQEEKEDKKTKASVFSRISLPCAGGGGSSSSIHRGPTSVSNGAHHEAMRKRGEPVCADHDSSDEDRHFKRRRSRYNSSPVAEEEQRHSRGREKERYSSSSKRR